MNPTTINWPGLTHTLNPITGCPGCELGDTCYAKKLHDKRHKAYLEGKKVPECYAKPFNEYQFFPERLKALDNKNHKSIFVGSMSDMWRAPVEYLLEVMITFQNYPQHTYWFLTKQPENYGKTGLFYTNNFWMGTTITSLKTYHTYSELLKTISHKGCKSFISLEPFLEDMGEIDLSGVDLVIVGPDTTPGASYDPKWIENIKAKKIHYKNPEKWKGE